MKTKYLIKHREYDLYLSRNNTLTQKYGRALRVGRKKAVDLILYYGGTSKYELIADNTLSNQELKEELQQLRLF